ncbi:hypothetical protein [Hymenobacter algoricola]|uniref:Uncharacterized protein n=1 Tax=Hymenobacter algoricola TaxID=486267 RepID=A0ABP7N9R8_9BACT
MSRLDTQLAMRQHLQRHVMRARRRLLRRPTPFFVRALLASQQDADLFTDALLMQVPTAHDEAVYALAASLSSSSEQSF